MPFFFVAWTRVACVKVTGLQPLLTTDSQCNSIATKTLSSRVLFLLFICSTSFLSFCRIIQRHRINQFTLYTGINVWPHQAWLTVLFFMITHVDLLSLNINQWFDQQIQLAHACPKHGLHAPSTIHGYSWALSASHSMHGSFKGGWPHNYEVG